MHPSGRRTLFADGWLVQNQGGLALAHIFSFDTSALAPAEATTAYLASIDGTLETDFLETPFSATMEACDIGTMRVIRLLASARRSTRNRQQLNADRHDGIGFQLVLSGHASGRAGWRQVESAPGGIMVLDYGKPFTIEDHETRDVVNLAVPRVLLALRNIDLSTLHGTVITGPRALLLTGLLGSMPASIAHIGDDDAIRLQEILLDTIAIMLKPETVQSTMSEDEKLFRKALVVIDRRIGSADLTPEFLARKLRISRARAHKLFLPHGGVSRAIWQRRLNRARETLLNPADRRKVGKIAYDHGFSSEAHFSRAFRKAFGVSASQMRREAVRGSMTRTR